jgi:hypothetical protein
MRRLGRDTTVRNGRKADYYRYPPVNDEGGREKKKITLRRRERGGSQRKR